MLAACVAAEEPDIVTLAIRPGVVDTEMQREVREDYKDKLSHASLEKFESMHREGKLVAAADVGKVMGRLALEAEKQYSGQFINWNDEAFSKYAK
jgi:NAD(P)-dependent dehydrogenase (short-subunit alcohol dehydrogenase family)